MAKVNNASITFFGRETDRIFLIIWARYRRDDESAIGSLAACLLLAHRQLRESVARWVVNGQTAGSRQSNRNCSRISDAKGGHPKNSMMASPGIPMTTALRNLRASGLLRLPSPATPSRVRGKHGGLLVSGVPRSFGARHAALS